MAKPHKFFALVCCICSLSIFAQTNSSPAVRNASTRYKQDYEIKGISNPGADLLSKINIASFDYLRQKDKRVEAKDNVNHIVLILYSENEVAAEKQQHLQESSNVKTVTDVKYISTPKIE
jgi:hypothetical protein